MEFTDFIQNLSSEILASMIFGCPEIVEITEKKLAQQIHNTSLFLKLTKN